MPTGILFESCQLDCKMDGLRPVVQQYQYFTSLSLFFLELSSIDIIINMLIDLRKHTHVCAHM